MGEGERAARPFNRRILLPLLCGSRVWCWQLVSYSSLFLLPCLTAVYVFQRLQSPEAALFAALLMAGLPTMQFWLKTPVLTDAPAMVFALAAAILPWPWNLVTAVVGGFARETVPLFAALYAWNPVLLLALVPIGIYAKFAPVGADQLGREAWLAHPFRIAQNYKSGQWRNPLLMLTPWGAGLACLWFVSEQLVAVLAVAYAQLLVATDAARLYVWAAPVVLLGAAMIDIRLMPVLVVVHWLNPWRGSGA